MQKHLDVNAFAQDVMQWYRAYGASLPWRGQPGSCTDVYSVWVSEIMLQQTTVPVVQRYYPRFVRRFPTVHAMAQAPLQEVLAFWAGLGYYRRAHNMHKCAQDVVKRYGGVWPACVKELKALPGIGDYTAGAIMAIARQKPGVAADTNVVRVVSRVLELSPKKVLEALKELHLSTPGDFYQGVMDIGRLMCGKRRTHCVQCPLRARCRFYQQGGRILNGALDRKITRKPVKHACFFVFKKEEKYYFCQGTPEGTMLAGLWIFPSTAWMGPEEFQMMRQSWSQAAQEQTRVAVLRHTFSHFTLDAYMVDGVDVEQACSYEGKWLGEDLTAYPLSSLAQKLFRVYQRRRIY